MWILPPRPSPISNETYLNPLDPDFRLGLHQIVLVDTSHLNGMDIFHQNSCIIPRETDANVEKVCWQIIHKPTNKQTDTGEYVTSLAELIIQLYNTHYSEWAIVRHEWSFVLKQTKSREKQSGYSLLVFQYILYNWDTVRYNGRRL